MLLRYAEVRQQVTIEERATEAMVAMKRIMSVGRGRALYCKRGRARAGTVWPCGAPSPLLARGALSLFHSAYPRHRRQCCFERTAC